MNYKKFLKFSIILLLLLLAGVAYSIAKQNAIISVYHNYVRLADIAYYLSVVDWFWQAPGRNIYEISEQQKLFSNLLGHNQFQVFPVNISPLALIIFFPFSKFWHQSMEIGYILWLYFSLVLLCLALTINFLKLSKKNLRNAIVALVAICILVDSSCFLNTIANGQTSIFASAMLLFLLTELTNEKRSKRQEFLLIVIMFLLSIKPQYFALGSIFLIIFQRFRILIFSCLMLFILLLTISFYGGFELLPSYLHTIGLYQQIAIPKEYTDGFSAEVIGLMNIFPVAFGAMIGVDLAKRLSAIMLFFITFIPLIFSFYLSKYNSLQLLSFRVSCSVVPLCGYLLFSPHLGNYEELLFIVILLGGLLVYQGNESPALLLILFWLSCLWFGLNFHIYNITIINAWIVKVIFLSSITIEVFKTSLGSCQKSS